MGGVWDGENHLNNCVFDEMKISRTPSKEFMLLALAKCQSCIVSYQIEINRIEIFFTDNRIEKKLGSDDSPR